MSSVSNDFMLSMSSWKWKEPENGGMFKNTIGILIAERWMTNVPNQFYRMHTEREREKEQK